MNKMTTRTAREAEMFLLKTLSMWNDTDRGKTSTPRESCPSATWSTSILHGQT